MSEDDEVREAFAEHVAHGPTHVVMVHFYMGDGDDRHEVFSTLAQAEAWANDMHAQYGDGAAIFAPRIIDCPEYGNIPAEQLQ
jgi:hypothetical protein